LTLADVATNARNIDVSGSFDAAANWSINASTCTAADTLRSGVMGRRHVIPSGLVRNPTDNTRRRDRPVPPRDIISDDLWRLQAYSAAASVQYGDAIDARPLYDRGAYTDRPCIGTHTSLAVRDAHDHQPVATYPSAVSSWLAESNDVPVTQHDKFLHEEGPVTRTRVPLGERDFHTHPPNPSFGSLPCDGPETGGEQFRPQLEAVIDTEIENRDAIERNPTEHLSVRLVSPASLTSSFASPNITPSQRPRHTPAAPARQSACSRASSRHSQASVRSCASVAQPDVFALAARLADGLQQAAQQARQDAAAREELLRREAAEREARAAAREDQMRRDAAERERIQKEAAQVEMHRQIKLAQQLAAQSMQSTQDLAAERERKQQEIAQAEIRYAKQSADERLQSAQHLADERMQRKLVELEFRRACETWPNVDAYSRTYTPVAVEAGTAQPLKLFMTGGDMPAHQLAPTTSSGLACGHSVVEQAATQTQPVPPSTTATSTSVDVTELMRTDTVVFDQLQAPVTSACVLPVAETRGTGAGADDVYQPLTSTTDVVQEPALIASAPVANSTVLGQPVAISQAIKSCAGVVTTIQSSALSNTNNKSSAVVNNNIVNRSTPSHLTNVSDVGHSLDDACVAQPHATVSVPSLPAPAVVVPSPPVVVVKQVQFPKAYNGSTNWKSFHDHYERIARTNGWTSIIEKTQNLPLSLEGPAADILKDLDETADSAYTDIWSALARRFGNVDEPRDAMRRFDNRKQTETESVAEYAQALRMLYRDAWPTASSDQRDLGLKRRFEDGLVSAEMSQFLRLHARSDNFDATVLKARQFLDAAESKPKKTVRILKTPGKDDPIPTPPQPDMQPLLDGLKEVIACVRESRPQVRNLQSPTRTPPAARQAGRGSRSGQRASSQSQSPAPGAQVSPRQSSPGDRSVGGRPVSPDPGTREFNGRHSSPGFRFSSSGARRTSSGSRPMSPSNQAFSPGQRQFNTHNQQSFRRRYSSPGPRFGTQSGHQSPGSQTNYPQWFGGNTPRPANNGWQPRTFDGNSFNGPRLFTPQYRPRPQSVSTVERRRYPCWVCGTLGCHTRFHAQPQPQSNVQETQLFSPSEGNALRGSDAGNRAPPATYFGPTPQ